MITYVNTVFVSNTTPAVVKFSKIAEPTNPGTPSADAGKFVVITTDSNNPDAAVDVTEENADKVESIKIGIIEKRNIPKIDPESKKTVYVPSIRWSNVIKVNDIKSLTFNAYANDEQEKVEIDLSGLNSQLVNLFAEGGKRVITRLTFKDMPTRYRKWTESYEYVTNIGDTAETIATNIANMINKEWKRARVFARVEGSKILLEAMLYDDDNAIDTLNWAGNVRFNVNMYYTDPAAEGWESLNKHYLTGVKITKTPGKIHASSAKLVRDREAQAMGYLGILNRGACTWPIIKPEMETSLDVKYDALTLEFENMYRAADDIFRKTKQTVEIYAAGLSEASITTILAKFCGNSLKVEKGHPDASTQP